MCWNDKSIVRQESRRQHVARATARRLRSRRVILEHVERLEPRTMLAADYFLVPGGVGDVVQIRVKIDAQVTTFHNEVGVYTVENPSGEVDGQLPGTAGYAAAVLDSGGRQVLFPTGGKLGQTRTLTVAGGSELAFYLVQNSTSANLLAQNPTDRLGHGPYAFFSAEKKSLDGFDHVHSRKLRGGRIRFAFEDQLRGGDHNFANPAFIAKVVSIAHRPAPPAILAGLANDTGRSATDGITRDASIMGVVQAANPVSHLSARLDGNGAFVDVSDSLQTGGAFTLSMATLGQLAGGTLAQGSAHPGVDGPGLRGIGLGGLFVDVHVDTTAPALNLSLDPASDSLSARRRDHHRQPGDPGCGVGTRCADHARRPPAIGDGRRVRECRVRRSAVGARGQHVHSHGRRRRRKRLLARDSDGHAGRLARSRRSSKRPSPTTPE